jgi:hypothetical protein
MASTSPTQRTLRLLREQGAICEVVEKFNPHVGPYGIRQDLFGFIDIIALMPGKGILAIQSCGQDVRGHINKIYNDRSIITFEWLKYAEFQIYGWRKLKLKRGGKAMRWRPRIVDFKLDGNGNITHTEL